MTRFIDLSHNIDAGMVTYRGLPAPIICDFLSHAGSDGLYEAGTSFAIQRLDMVGNTGTYLDSPFHRYPDGTDLAGLALAQLADLPALVIAAPSAAGVAIDADAVAGLDVGGRAVLFHSGWDRHWRTDAYFNDHPFLTAAAAAALVTGGAALVGIDSHNIDDTRGDARPVHTILLGAGIPICEHMTNLAALPAAGARFHAVPPKFVGVGTFAVRAFAIIG